MADIQPLIKQASEAYGKALDTMKDELAKLVGVLAGEGLTREQLFAELFETDFQELVTQFLGMDKATGQLITAHGRILDKMERFGSVSEEMLSALVSLDEATLISRTAATAQTAKKTVLHAVLGGSNDMNDMAELVRASLEESISTAAAKAEANTALNTFSRAVTNEMAESAHKNTKYVYEGPVDDKTRPICVEMAAAGALTKAEIDSQFPGTFIDGGGYNCRHGWNEIESAFFVNEKKAKEIVKANKKKASYVKPKTPLQLAKEKANG